MTLVQLLGWLRWVDQGADEQDRLSRARRVRKHVFPPKLDAAERARREELLEEVRRLDPDDGEMAAITAEAPPDGTQNDHKPPLPPVEPEPLRWDGLISSSSPAYRRASLRDGTYDETKRMRDLGQGSPFDADVDAYPVHKAPPRKAAPQIEPDEDDDDLPRRQR